MIKDEQLKTQIEVIELLLLDGKEIKPNYFSKLVKEGRLPTHKKRGSPKKFYYYSEIKPHFIENSLSEEIIKKETLPDMVNTTENNDELELILQEAQTAVQKVQIIKDFWTGKINQQKYEVEKGLYYTKEEINKKAEYVLMSSRNKFLSMPSKIAPSLIGLETIAEAEAIISEAVYEILEELSKINELV